MDIKSQLESSLPADQQHLLRFVADIAGSLGFPVYIVGGSVRDLLLGHAINDLDLTVEGDSRALAESMLKRLGGKVMIHAKFGTARWTPTESTFERLNVPMLTMDSLPPHLDFVSTRSEIYTSPGVLPKVKRSSIQDDLRRRDFTINAMAVRLDGIHFGALVDILDGRADLERSLIRVLHPRSFIDDPTRMFRAVRYAVRYGFEIEPETLKLFNDEARSVLAELSGERLRHEFDLIFEEANPIPALKKIKELGLLRPIHPALPSADEEMLAKAKDQPAENIGGFAVPDILSFQQTLGWVLYLMGLSEKDIEEMAERLDFPALLTKAASAGTSLYKDLSSFKDWKPSQWTFHLDELPPLAVYAVWLVTSEESLREYLEKWRNVKPFTTGDDLKKLGLIPGPKYKEILSGLRAAWLNGEVKTKEEEFAFRNRLIAK
ncbi:MAG TPA: hypothetical protein VJ972_07020 [Anaerolineales bacterium]|nr:hypothetical protein [Anaerolineales bacterium]